MKRLLPSAPPSDWNSRRIHPPTLPTPEKIIRRLLFLLVLLVLSSGGVLSQPSATGTQPTDGPFAYHQLRPGAGLGGSGFGVDAQGRLSLSGPIAFSTPVANTLGHNRFVIGGSQYSFSSKPVFNTDQANWSAFVMYGNTVGRSINAALTANIVDVQEDVVFNFQMQYVPPENSRLTLSAGIADITDPGTSKTIDYGGFRTSSFSPFAVATYRVNPGRYTTHLTAGTGMRRFAPFFGSITVQLARPLRLWIEQDRFGNNLGLLYTTKFGSGAGGGPFSVGFGVANGEYTLFQTSISF